MRTKAVAYWKRDPSRVSADEIKTVPTRWLVSEEPALVRAAACFADQTRTASQKNTPLGVAAGLGLLKVPTETVCRNATATCVVRVLSASLQTVVPRASVHLGRWVIPSPVVPALRISAQRIDHVLTHKYVSTDAASTSVTELCVESERPATVPLENASASRSLLEIRKCFVCLPSLHQAANRNVARTHTASTASYRTLACAIRERAEIRTDCARRSNATLAAARRAALTHNAAKRCTA